ncbi:unknown [Bacteroides thetaiotaomicron CAG:40]|nr:unknown [Bacteroides thetaiotaomicron CAG:40]
MAKQNGRKPQQTAGKGQQHGRTDNRNRIPYKTVTIWQSKAAGNRKLTRIL